MRCSLPPFLSEGLPAQSLVHPTVVTLKGFFFVDGAHPEDDVFLNLVRASSLLLAGAPHL